MTTSEENPQEFKQDDGVAPKVDVSLHSHWRSKTRLSPYMLTGQEYSPPAKCSASRMTVSDQTNDKVKPLLKEGISSIRRIMP